ncbi:protocadherin-15 [Plakobranchus ocellatus]|uniref:Protocadherin-15 n=1 Tax=Plakobranchus ocellatus TaxID=259542 RepID=A0AAV4C2Z7_9GAST|nr:protocadherin-15 [Plakobranchus ocellatus]
MNNFNIHHDTNWKGIIPLPGQGKNHLWASGAVLRISVWHGESKGGEESDGKLPHNAVCQEQSGPYSWEFPAASLICRYALFVRSEDPDLTQRLTPGHSHKRSNFSSDTIIGEVFFLEEEITVLLLKELKFYSNRKRYNYGNSSISDMFLVGGDFLSCKCTERIRGLTSGSDLRRQSLHMKNILLDFATQESGRTCPSHPRIGAYMPQPPKNRGVPATQESGRTCPSHPRIGAYMPQTPKNRGVHAPATQESGPCDPVDTGDYLGTKPILLFSVDEATASEIENSETAGDMKYYTHLPLHGVAGTDFSVSSTASSVVDPMLYFSIIHSNGKNYMKLMQPLDREGMTASLDDDVSVINFIIKCSPTNTALPQQIYDASLIINDVNDNNPKFNDFEPVTLSENTVNGSVVARLSASDEDLNLDQPLQYALEQDYGKFSIDNMTGEIFLTSKLDFEAMGADKYYNLRVITTDGGPGVTRSATAILKIDIIDADDQGPVFVYNGCLKHNGQCAWPSFRAGLNLKKDEAIKVVASPSTDSNFVLIRAKDLDGSSSKDLTFRIASTVPAGQESKFRVETTIGSGPGEFVASVIANNDMTVAEGFQILLAAEEQSVNKRTAVALIRFSEHGTAQANSQGGLGSENNGDDDNDSDEYTDTEIALIVAVSVLASFFVCAIFALLYVCRRPRTKKQSDLAMQGHTNNGFSARL